MGSRQHNADQCEPMWIFANQCKSVQIRANQNKSLQVGVSLCESLKIYGIQCESMQIIVCRCESMPINAILYRLMQTDGSQCKSVVYSMQINATQGRCKQHTCLPVQKSMCKSPRLVALGVRVWMSQCATVRHSIVWGFMPVSDILLEALVACRYVSLHNGLAYHCLGSMPVYVASDFRAMPAYSIRIARAMPTH